MRIGLCSVIGCGKHSKKRGMCESHYRKALRTGKIGRIRAIGATIWYRLSFHSKRIPRTGCLEWTGSRHAETGYGSITINRKSVSTHRAAWEAENGVIPDGLHILHKCDNPICINPNHLFLGTNADNVADMVSKGRNVIVRGEGKGNSKLTDDLVRKIRVDARTHREIADELGVGHTVIGMVKARQIWKHVA